MPAKLHVLGQKQTRNWNSGSAHHMYNANLNLTDVGIYLDQIPRVANLC